MNTDSQAGLLERFIQSQDPEAFTLITRQYAGMVYGTCNRITRNDARAADATQETFFHLAKHARQVNGSLAGWLHRVAVGKAVNLVRSDMARRRREEQYATQPRATDDWSEISPLVDEALQELDDEPRDILIRHYLQGETLTSLAATKGISQPTMSRRADAALEQLRCRLKTKGVLVAGLILGGLMSNASLSAPVAVLAQLGKMALVTSGAAAASTTPATVLGLNAKLLVVSIIAVAGVSGFVAYKAKRPMRTAPPLAITSVRAETATASNESTTTTAGLPIQTVGAPDASPSATATATPDPVPISGVALPLGFGGRPAPGEATLSDAAAIPESRAVAVVNSGPPPTRATIDGALTLFATTLVRGDAAQVEKCFADAAEATAFRRILEFPKNDAEHEVQRVFQSIGPRIEVGQITTTEEDIRVKWKARVRQPFTLTENGIAKTWQRGDRFELETRLKQIGGEWKIVGF